MTPAAVDRAVYLVAGLAFVVLATANAGAYRYGVSDQAFYIPVVTRALDPAAFPRDAALIDAQGALMLADEALAGLVRATGLSLETVFLAAYLLSVALIWIGVVAIGRRVSADRWTTMALGAAITLRHRITRTSANSLEPYFHPRILAFGFGVLAVAAVLHRRRGWAIVSLLVATAVHVTTGAWFGVLLGVAFIVLDPFWRRLAVPVSVAGAGALAWAVWAGPLRGRLVRMDEVWLHAVASKDSLFATEWPLSAWLANLGLLAVLWAAFLWRRSREKGTAEDRALVWGATALVGVFLITLPLVAAAFALPVQLQISRVFWLVDFVATIYVVAALGDAPWMTGSGRRVLAGLLLAVSVARGAFIVYVDHPERPLFEAHLPVSPWTDAMRWLAAQPKDVHVLADPGHAWKYGSSVRVAAGRDVFLEETKDSAVAIYSRDVAARVVERTDAVGDFASMTVASANALAARYQLHYLVTESHLPLPAAFENSQFRIYPLGPGGRAP